MVVSPDGRDGSVSIQQDAYMLAGLFDGDERATHAIAPGRLAYVHLVRGEAVVNGHTLAAGDALLYENEPAVIVADGRQCEVLVFDLPRV
jgi:redox-sensitive bicupin YhaK (pirin superfamily)